MGRNLPLKTRRRKARGFNARHLKFLASRKFTGLGNRATLTMGPAGANNDLVFYARTPGTGGNAITVAIVVAGNNTPLSVGVVGNAITINSATNGSAAATSTANDVIAAVRASAAANALVNVSRKYGDDGTGVVAAVAATALSGAV